MSRRSLHAGKVCTEMAGLTKFSLHGISEDLQTLISIRRCQFCVWKSTKYLTRSRAIRRPLGSASRYSSVSSRYHWTAPQMERRKQWNFQKQELRQEAKLSPIFSTVRQTLSSRRERDLPPQKHSEKEFSFSQSWPACMAVDVDMPRAKPQDCDRAASIFDDFLSKRSQVTIRGCVARRTPEIQLTL